MTDLQSIVRRLAADEGGQDLIEYALLAAFIGTVGLLTWQAIGGGVKSDYVGWDSNIQSLSATTPDPIGSGT